MEPCRHSNSPSIWASRPKASGRKLERNYVFWLDMGDGYVCPAFQIGKCGLLRGIGEVLDIFTINEPGMRVNFMLTSDAHLSDDRPIDLLRNGKIDDVVTAAAAYGDYRRFSLRVRHRGPISWTKRSRQEDQLEESFDRDNLGAALDRIAAWLLAAYGARLERVSLSLEGYYGPISECYGIVPITLDRGTAPDGSQETRETLPGSEIRDHAEALLARLVPEIRCTRDSGRDVREVASSELLSAGDVSAHRRIELLNAYGRLPTASRSARQ